MMSADVQWAPGSIGIFAFAKYEMNEHKDMKTLRREPMRLSILLGFVTVAIANCSTSAKYL